MKKKNYSLIIFILVILAGILYYNANVETIIDINKNNSSDTNQDVYDQFTEIYFIFIGLIIFVLIFVLVLLVLKKNPF